MRKLSLSLFLASASLVYAQAPKSRPAPVKYWDTNWESLFNGKDLSGWVKIGHEKWEVDDGTIHGQGISKEYGYLRTEKKFKDFHLSLRFKCEAPGNSGVFVHSDFDAGTARVSQGMQFEIDPHLNHHTGGLYGDGRQWIAWPSPEYEGVIHPTDPAPKSFDGYISLQLHSGGEGNMRFKDLFIHDLSQR